MNDAQLPVVNAPTPYERRHVAHLRNVVQHGWHLKVYGISVRDGDVRPRLVESALTTAAAVLPVAEGRDDGHGIGFLVVHDTPVLAYALVNWWSERNEIHQKVYSAPSDRPTELAPHHSPAIGCVWELSVLDFERRAWITDILNAPDGPDVAAYLSRRFTDDV